MRSAQAARDAQSAGPSAWERLEEERQREEMAKAGVTLDGLLAALSKSSPDDPVFAHRFALYLKLFPGEAKRLASILPGLDEKAAALLFNILELAGTPQAQEVLTAAMDSRGLSNGDRFRALVAMTGLEHPTAETIARVSQASRAGGRGEEEELASTALLVLGALSQRAPGELGREITRGLADGLRASDDSDQQALYLRAMENARAALPATEGASLLRSESPAVRAAAASVLALQPDRAAVDELVELLARERDPSVLTQLLDALQALPPNARVNEAVARALAGGGETDAMVRARLVAYLGSTMRAFPANRGILQGAMRQETNRDVMLAIANALAVR
jgi:HEAT repeat protein